MPSEAGERLHPLSFLFALRAQVRALLIPVLLFAFGAGSLGWQFWLVPFAGVYLLAVLMRSLSLRYRYEGDELVIRTGFLFRNERHVPFARIQNVDAVQHVEHRLFGVAEVRIETAGGQEPEATLRVLPLAAVEAMRKRILVQGRVAVAAAPDVAASREEPVLRLPLRETLLYGVIQNRGMVVIGAVLGVASETGLLQRVTDGALGGNGRWHRGFVRSTLALVFGGQGLSAGRIALAVVAVLVFLLVVRMCSAAWAAARLHGFTLLRAGADLRADYGLLTRVSATIPLGRIQTLTILEGPLHRLFGRASIRVETAGGGGGEEGGGEAIQREWLAPLLPAHDVPRLLAEVLPGAEPGALEWQRVHPRALRRALKSSFLVVGALAVPLLFLPGWWDLALVAALFAWAWIDARRSVAQLGYALTDRAVWFRSGWFSRSVTVARFAKIQAVALRESPFDRRSAMASVHVDTAGATATGHRIAIRYLGVEVAHALRRRLALEAARTAFRW